MFRFFAVASLLVSMTSAAVAENSTFSCMIDEEYVGDVCYNHHQGSCHEGHIRERCNAAYYRCSNHPGGCASSGCNAGSRFADGMRHNPDQHKCQDGEPWPYHWPKRYDGRDRRSVPDASPPPGR